jgi:branched-chain amino acid transport system substrate-binding protein
MQQKLYPEKLQVSLDTFVQRMYLQNWADNPKLVSKIVVKWTQGQPLLTKKLLQYLLQSEARIDEGEEALSVEKVIRNRLLKEFKQDELTLTIRKLLYKKDLQNLLEVTDSQLSQNDQLYLLKIQKSLGLTNQQCQGINIEKLGLNTYFSLYQKSKNISELDNTYKLYNTEDNHLIHLESAIIYEQSDLVLQSLLEPEIQPQPTKSKSSTKKWWLLLLWTPFLFLSLKGFGWLRQYQISAQSNSNSEPQKLCVDLTSRQSPRMSLGEKLLTKENQLNPSSNLNLYQGMAAFARCEFSAAQDEYEQSLAIDKNNPEALIYYNNSEAIAGENFKIAVSVPLGSKPDIAWEILRGVAQAQTEINEQGGINNKLLLVQIVNDDNDPRIVRQVAKELSADKNIMAVVGHNDSNSSIAGAKIYETKKLVMISPTSTSTQLSGMGGYIMRTIPSVSALANKLADYAVVNSITKIAVCSDSQDSASSSFAQEFMTQTVQKGGQIKSINCDFAQGDFQPKSMISKAVAQNVDAVLLAPSVNQISQAIAVATANQHQLLLLGNHSLYTHETIAVGKSAIAGMVIPSPWLSDEIDSSNFPEAAMQYWGAKVNWRTAMAYDATGAIIEGLKASNDRSELQATLTQANFSVDGATGKFHFQQGDRLGKVDLAFVEKSAGDDDRYQFSRLELRSNSNQQLD